MTKYSLKETTFNKNMSYFRILSNTKVEYLSTACSICIFFEDKAQF